MSTFRSFIVLMGLRGVQPYMPLRVMRQLGRRQFIPPNEDMREFMYEFHPNIPLRQSEIFMIWGMHTLKSPRYGEGSHKRRGGPSILRLGS